MVEREDLIFLGDNLRSGFGFVIIIIVRVSNYQKRCSCCCIIIVVIAIVVVEISVDVSIVGDDGLEFIGYKIWDLDGWMGILRRLRDVVHGIEGRVGWTGGPGCLLGIKMEIGGGCRALKEGI